MTFNNGQMTSAVIKNLDGNARKWDRTCDNWNISEDEINWFFGYDCEADISDNDKVKTILTIWGIYYGGITQADFETRYNLTGIQFNKLVQKDYIDLEIEISDTFNFIWTF